MVERVEFQSPETGAAPPPPAGPERPAHIPEKFWKDGKVDTDAMARSYTELETKQSQAKPTETPAAAAKPEEAKPSEAAAASGDEKKEGDAPKGDEAAEAAKKVAAAANVDLSSYQQEYDTTGDVAPEKRKEIAEKLKGVLGDGAESIVNDFIEGRKALQNNDKALYMDAAGGAERYGDMVAWAKENLKPEEIATYNAQIASGDRQATLFAINGLAARFAASGAVPPRRLNGAGGPVGNTAMFTNVAQMQAAMNDPKYATDEAYRKSVAMRIPDKW